MTPQQIVEHLESHFPGVLRGSFAIDKHPRVHLDSPDWRAVAEHLFRAPELSFDWLANLSGIDYAADDKMAVVYDLWSTTHLHRFAVKVFMPRPTPIIATVSDIWPAANWHEREGFDLFGITFTGHPNPTRILLADDWVGHPLKKDYVFPREYHGIPGSVELDWQQDG